MRGILLSLCLSVLVSLAFVSLVVAYTPRWQVEFENSLSGYGDRFVAGVGQGASDGFDPGIDIFQPPTAPGISVQMTTNVDGKKLMRDYRDGNPETWEITLLASDPAFEGLSGVDVLSWNLVDVPSNTKLTLVDYGSDSSRTKVVDSASVIEGEEYTFDVEGGVGSYRYLSLEVEGTSESPRLCKSDCREVYKEIKAICVSSYSDGKEVCKEEKKEDKDGCQNLPFLEKLNCRRNANSDYKQCVSNAKDDKRQCVEDAKLQRQQCKNSC